MDKKTRIFKLMHPRCFKKFWSDDLMRENQIFWIWTVFPVKIKQKKILRENLLFLASQDGTKKWWNDRQTWNERTKLFLLPFLASMICKNYFCMTKKNKILELEILFLKNKKIFRIQFKNLKKKFEKILRPNFPQFHNFTI